MAFFDEEAVRRASALIALGVCLIVCRPAGGAESGAGAPRQNTGSTGATASAPAATPSAVAVPSSTTTAGVPTRVAATPDAGAASDPASKPAPAPKAPSCAQMRRWVEQELTAARSCQAADECVVVETFEYTFRPCGLGVRKGAPLDKARADAKAYQDQCRPIVHPVKCPYLPRAICQRGQCVLAPPAAP